MKLDSSITYTPAGKVLTTFMLEMFRFHGHLLTSGDRLVADLGLTSARWQVLGAIGIAGTSLPVSHIARNMGLSRQAVQRLVNELAADGLVGFAANPHHRRAKLVLLTPAGERAYRAALDRQTPWANSLAEGLDERDVSIAINVVRALARRLETEQGQPLMGQPNELRSGVTT